MSSGFIFRTNYAAAFSGGVIICHHSMNSTTQKQHGTWRILTQKKKASEIARIKIHDLSHGEVRLCSSKTLLVDYERRGLSKKKKMMKTNI